MTEPASVVAARQLAEEARDRPVPRPARRRVRRARAALVAAGVVTTAGCAGGGPQVCPAIGYGSALVVQLASAWPGGAERSVELDCEPACPAPFVELEEASPVPLPGMPGTPAAPSPTSVAPAPDPVVAVDAAGRAVLQLYGAQPDEVTVRVLQDGAVVAELTEEPRFVRIDGTADCGGNTEARIAVPAP